MIYIEDDFNYKLSLIKALLEGQHAQLERQVNRVFHRFADPAVESNIWDNPLFAPRDCSKWLVGEWVNYIADDKKEGTLKQTKKQNPKIKRDKLIFRWKDGSSYQTSTLLDHHIGSSVVRYKVKNTNHGGTIEHCVPTDDLAVLIHYDHNGDVHFKRYSDDVVIKEDGIILWKKK